MNEHTNTHKGKYEEHKATDTRRNVHDIFSMNVATPIFPPLYKKKKMYTYICFTRLFDMYTCVNVLLSPTSSLRWPHAKVTANGGKRKKEMHNDPVGCYIFLPPSYLFPFSSSSFLSFLSTPLLFLSHVPRSCGSTLFL